LIAISEANRLIVYSPILAAQIPRSYAANAFNVFQWSALNYEIVRVCALWDNPRRDRASIPTVLKLIEGRDCRPVIEKALGPYPQDIIRNMRRLDRAVHVAELVRASRFHAALREFRDEKVAHNLDFAVRAVASRTLKYGYERRLLRASIAVVSNLNNALRDSSFMFDDAIGQSKRNAAALWNGCTFVVRE
jgi:hypothetical protein